LPWPVDKVYRYRSEQIQTVTVGGVEEEEHGKEVVLWTVAHAKEENFLVANRAQPAAETAAATSGRKAPPVSLITVSIPVQFQITNLTQWVYQHEDSSNLLRQIATREVVRYLASVDVNEIMSHGRLESAMVLRDKIQGAADARTLGARILFVGLQDLHPPVKVAPEYQKVVAAIHQKQAKILAAEADSIRVTTLASAQAVTVTNAAEAARINLQVIALARAAAFTNQLPAFNAAPDVYRQRAYLQTFASATARATKYLVLATNTSDVITFDLQRRLDEDYFNKIGGAVPPPKK
jgi:regulator of protease activity HflC (stomatin/prohibitin superfamily)